MFNTLISSRKYSPMFVVQKLFRTLKGIHVT